MKSLSFAHNGKSLEVHTQDAVLKALLAEHVPVIMACGGRGMCATCHVYIERGPIDGLSPRTKREERTLGLIAEATPQSRLACQAQVLKDGVVVRLPEALYIQKAADLTDLIGRRAESPVRHPVDGRVLVRGGHIITRSTVEKLSHVESDLQTLLTSTKSL